MKKTILISLFLHITLLSSFILFKYEKPKEKTIVKIEFMSGGSTAILELNENGTKLKTGKFYWGIGVYTDTIIKKIGNTQAYGYLVNEVSTSYTAYQVGIQKGDFIFKVNGNEIDEYANDIRGDEPKTMVLTIYRNGVILNVKIERTKVYY